MLMLREKEFPRRWNRMKMLYNGKWLTDLRESGYRGWGVDSEGERGWRCRRF